MTRVLRVAVPSPLATHFDYLPLPNLPVPPTGARVRVPFGRRETVGVILGISSDTDVPIHKLRPIKTVLDEQPLFPDRLMELLTWASHYYHHPIGEVMSTALPVLLRRGDIPRGVTVVRYALAADADGICAQLSRAPVQKRLIQLLASTEVGLTAADIESNIPGWRSPLQRLMERDLVVKHESSEPVETPAPVEPAPSPNSAQAEAIAAIVAAREFECFLVDGVTGSGKTEVYLGAIERTLAAGRQVLVLVPEIGLTPQLVERFRRRLGKSVTVMHSALNDSERLAAWQATRTGTADVLIGTRSAVFTPLPRLGLVVIDEEHDLSFKQQDGFRYHARDVAIKRASLECVPVVLGSATPSLESIHNANEGRYRRLSLPERAGAARPPKVNVLDLRRLPRREGLSPPLLEALRDRLERHEQSLLFLNRRGFSPVLMCHDCGWTAPCHRCDARLTVHRRIGKLRCHHCGADEALPENCPECGGQNLHGLGEGTERIESILKTLLPKARIERIDRDSTRRKGSLEAKLERVGRGDVDILVGTQMLAKGHDFHNLTLVGVLNADQGLYSSDFRGEERMVQQLVQVTGRAGRGDKPGDVLIQTWHPEHPAFASLVHHDYGEFARSALTERAAAGYPPFAHLALWRAESSQPGTALEFLRQLRSAMEAASRETGVTLFDPVSSPMERRAGRYRAQLLVQAAERRALHQVVDSANAFLGDSKMARRVRWSLDIDPVEMY